MKHKEAVALTIKIFVECRIPFKKKIDVPDIHDASRWFDDAEDHVIVFYDSTLNVSNLDCIRKIADENKKRIRSSTREGVKYLIIFTPKK